MPTPQPRIMDRPPHERSLGAASGALLESRSLPDGHEADVAAHRQGRGAAQRRGVDPGRCSRDRRGGPCRSRQDPARARGAGHAGRQGRHHRLGPRQRGRPSVAARCFRRPARRPGRRGCRDDRSGAGPARPASTAGAGRRRRTPAGRALRDRAAPRRRTPAGTGPRHPPDRGAGPRHRHGSVEGRIPPAPGPRPARRRRDRRPGHPGARRTGRFCLGAQVVGVDPGQPVVPPTPAGR